MGAIVGRVVYSIGLSLSRIEATSCTECHQAQSRPVLHAISSASRTADGSEVYSFLRRPCPKCSREVVRRTGIRVRSLVDRVVYSIGLSLALMPHRLLSAINLRSEVECRISLKANSSCPVLHA